MIKKLFTKLIGILCCVLLCCFYPNSNSLAKPKWKYIVIHHSGTTIGNAKKFDLYHRKVRKMKNGIAYHYVICNGTSGSDDGEIEITSRWQKQISGGHCKKQKNNNEGIGICLVGNFQKSKPTEDQYWSTVWLVRKMMNDYNIPLSNVKGHGEMRGENSKCPGKYFPWKRLRRDLAKKKK